jgi:hypothetical protein
MTMNALQKVGGNVMAWMHEMVRNHIVDYAPACECEGEIPPPLFKAGDQVTDIHAGGVGAVKSRLFVEEAGIWVYYIKWKYGPSNLCVSDEEHLRQIKRVAKDSREAALTASRDGHPKFVRSGKLEALKHLAKVFKEQGYEVMMR